MDLVLAGQEAQEQYSVTDVSNVIGWNPTLQTYPLIDYKTLNSSLTQAVWGQLLSTIWYFV